MLKNLLLLTAFAVVATAQPAPTEVKEESKEIDIKAFIQKSIDDLQNGKVDGASWVIKDRKQSPTGESFSTLLVVPESDTNQTIDNNNSSKPVAMTDESDVLYEDLEGLSFAHDINYSKESFQATSTLTALPEDDLTESEKKLVKKVIDEKILVLHSDYNLKDKKYNLSFKDINTTAEKATIVAKNIKATGLYDVEKPLDNSMKFTIDSLDITPFTAEFLGDYLKMKNLKITSTSSVKDTKLDFSYSIDIDLYDANISKEHSKLSKLSVNMTFGNMDLATYKELEKFGKENPTTTLENQKLQELTTKLLTSKGIYAEINNLTIGDLIVEGEKMGSANITAKVSLEENKELAAMIAMNPLMALSSLNVDAKIELSKEMLRAIMKDKRAGLLAILPSKEVDGKIVYVIKYGKGKLTVNGQAL